MKPIKTFGLAVLVMSMATAFAGASTAMAESTALCKTDPGKGANEVCPAGDVLTHVHAAGRVTILNSVLNVECVALSLEDASVGLANPLVTKGAFTFSSCHASCTVTEVNGPAKFEFLKLGHEAADYTLELELHLVCGELFNCTYNGVGLKGMTKGPLLSVEASGETSLSNQTLNKVSGFLCPSTSKIDFLLFTLLATHITN
jgi:hypothetical protein